MPSCRGSTCSSCSPSSTRRVSWCRRPRGSRGSPGWKRRPSDAEVAGFLREATEALLTLAKGDWPEREGAWHGLQSLFRLRWPWAPALSQAIAKPERAERWLFSKLPEWTEQPPRVPPRTVTLSDTDIADRLARLTGSGAERRQGQRDYAAAAAGAFEPRDMRDSPNLVLAEAGTGIGKTLGYLAPASLWAEQAGGAVWVSTFTKALQRQLGHESERLIADPELRKPEDRHPQGPRELRSACSTSRTRCRAVSRDAPRSWRS
jgi:ATP-dependent DNA helicase DinG